MDNLLLYRSLFKGREDVYAIHWSRGTKSGYMPAKLYDPYISKVYKKSTNPNSSETANYLPLTDDQIQRHLEGRQLTGLYPLLQDNTSWLIAADFDKNSWLEDCRSFITICASYNIPSYLERSRSGKGGHVWIFFNQPYPAFKSRIIVLTLLERAGIVSTFDKNSSFDRLFPNQDKHSGKGFGNLIALPLYKPTLELGNSCFIESETALPYRNQWEFLSSIRRISINDLDQIFLSLTSSKSLNVIEPGKLVIKLSNTIEINRNGISTALASFLKDELNFFNADFIIKKNSGRSTFGTKRYFKFIEEVNEYAIIPKGFIRKLLVYCIKNNIQYQLDDNRKLLTPSVFSFHASLREYQLPAVEVASKKDIGIIVAPPGSGKTVVGLKIIADKQQPALIVVHRNQLADQWAERIEAFLGIPKQDIGRIGQGKTKIGKRVTIAMIQSLGKELQKPGADQLVRAFGIIIVDECHHIAAETFKNAVSLFHSYYLYGLTATPFRKNSDDRLISVLLGEVISEMKSSDKGASEQPEIIIRNTTLNVAYNAKTDRFETLSNILIHDSERNKLILKGVTFQLSTGKRVVILTERKEHIETLHQYLKQSFETVTLSGDDSESSRNAKWKILKTGNYQVLITTGQFFGEGSDLHNAQCLFLVYPFSFEGKLIQYIGRVQRSELTPVIYDYRDIKIDYLNAMFLKRNVYYKKLIRHRTLFDDVIEVDEKVEPVGDLTSSFKDQIIERNIKVAIESLDFLYGGVVFCEFIKEIEQEVSFGIENLHMRPEFDVLKSYFEKFLNTKTITITICIVIEKGIIVGKSATCEDMKKLNREVVDSVRFRFAEKNLFKKGNLLGKNVEMFQLSAGDANQTLYESGEELLKDVLIRGNYRHKIQLRYLSDLHLGNVLKIRFVLSPFAFVFLLAGKEQYHIVMETLDTDEATYIWHTSKEVSELKNALHNVDKDLNKIRNDGRFAFLQSVPINFSRVLHDYSDERNGFVIWKDDLEQYLT
ncbi:DEAD/DEAH box helicase family protein [Pedobacter sp. ok626]|uniref:TOTE conflict system archaeo-eukaryotic primase domain-containing protein n=1 Tax=Pedobacter sp. ok626 TaxID=1761882 RepID=UPI00352AA172